MKMSLPDEAQAIVDCLCLEKINEGVYVKRIYEYNGIGDRPVATMIYGLATYGCPSRLHNLDCDEIWHFYAGNPMNIYIFKDGKAKVEKLGPDVVASQQPVVVVERGSDFGAMVEDSTHWCLFGCTCLPGFMQKGYNITKTDEKFYGKYADYKAVIDKLSNYK